MNKNLSYYMNLPYRVEVVEDKEEGGFALHCPELPGCITCADSVEQGFLMLEDAKKAWLTAALEDGFPIPEPSGLLETGWQFPLKIPRSLYRELSERSNREGVSLDQYCVYLLSKGVG